MSDTVPPKTVKIRTLPVLIKKNAITSCDELKSNYNLLFRCVKNANQQLYKEDIIYKTSERDVFNGKYPNLIITNRLNILKNSSRTVATYTGEDSTTVELSSDAVTSLIGQNNYDIVFSALCSVISQDLKVKGILSLLSLDTHVSTKTGRADQSTQTYQSSREILMREKQRKSIKKKPVRSYIVQDDMLPEKLTKKIVIHPKNLIEPDQIKTEKVGKSEEQSVEEENFINNNSTEEVKSNLLPDIRLLLDEDSNISEISSGNVSIGSYNIPDILENPKSLLMNIDKHTKETVPEYTTIVTMDGSLVKIKGNPDIFHLATPEVLAHLEPSDRKKIVLHQGYIDWKYCLHEDNNQNLPIHWAVLRNDVQLLKRQCLVLKSRHESVDVPSGSNMTALQMALFQDSAECVSELLRHGADPLAADGDARAAAHRAAAAAPAALAALLRAAARRARDVLQQHGDLWRPQFERKTDEELADHLLYKMCVMCDDQGYTPLMLASKEGKSENVKLLIEAAPSTINMRMPNCGNTALYLAVTAACLDCYSRGNKTEVSPNFYSTIDALVEGGADPTIDNDSGSNVNLLLTEFSIGKLSMLIANKLTSSKYFDGNETKDFNSYMLVKDSEGKVNLQELKSPKAAPPESKEKVPAHIVTLDANNEPQPLIETARRGTNEQTNTVVVKPKKKIKKRKPVILQNIPVVTQFVSLAQQRNRPLILKKFNKPKADAAEPPKVITLAQNFIPLQATVPMKFVKILPKVVQPPPAPLAATPPPPTGVIKRAKSDLNRSPKKIKL
ncbi:uncharacterized protein LOC126778702 [Nymphalis io]|uniref:uncharacterized protein LOC126778702 n=1 Tax=Inachis io TaxID=171585 RepID=UPI00216A1A0F|nr:uncharacterized protein LOC126778702 [Nymphalis io]